ncbi:MAG: hypothetical protein ACNS60_08450 [Candidatus Cyclobacteriaceae bacterium M2_1C_046]
MRLAQLARKLDIPKTEIIKFLSSRNISIETHGNTKVDQEYVDLLESKFGKKPSEEKPVSSSEEVVSADPKKPQDEASDEKTEELKPEPTSEIQEKPVEVIRPKKVKLQGIKVLGKIELPEPAKKKEEEEDKGNAEDIAQTEITPKKHVRKDSRKYIKKDRKPRRELSLEEKQKRAEQKRLREERKRKKELKEKKKRFYEKQVLAKVSPTKKSKKKKKEEPVQSTKKQVVKPKNIFRRFWAWLNGEYDQF